MGTTIIGTPVTTGAAAAYIGPTNLYATLDDLKASQNVTATTTDSIIMMLIGAASRQIDDYCKREFYPSQAVRYFDGPSQEDALARFQGHPYYVPPLGVPYPFGRYTERLLVDDLLSLTELATDQDGDGTYGTVWETTDYKFGPNNKWPKVEILTASDGDVWFPIGTASCRLTGLWGYGTGSNATPFVASGHTLSIDDSQTTASVTTPISIQAGHTIYVGSELIFVSAVDSDTGIISLVRGVNGTTAAVHASVAAYIVLYPPMITLACQWIAGQWWGERGHEGLSMEQFNEYRYQVRSDSDQVILRALGPYRRMLG